MKTIRQQGTMVQAIALFLALAMSAVAQDAKPTNLDTTQATGFLGDWTLTMEMQGEAVEVELTIVDTGGKVGAVVNVPMLPDPIVATEIEITETGLDVLFPVEFAGQTIDLKMSIAHKVVGVIADANGILSADFEGVRVGGGNVAAASTVTLKPSDMDTSTMGSYIGSWDMAMEVGGRPLTVVLQFLDLDGKVTALFQTPFSPEPENISDITISEEGTRLAFDAQMGGQTLPVEVFITSQLDDSMEGTFSAMGGALKADLVGSRTDTDLLAKLSSIDEKTRRRSRGGGTRQADLTLNENEIRVRYTSIKGDSPSAEKLKKLNDGEVFAFTDGRAIKIFSEADLVLGDAVLKIENAGPNYPGVYGLWLKKTAEGWSLVANRDADILGSQYRASADVAEFPIDVAPSDETSDAFIIELEEDGATGGVLKILWGNQVWSAAFTLGDRAIAKTEQ